MKRIGPELKMPKGQVPPVLKDLYLDLRDRRLLPLLALVLIAIVAVPLLLSEDRGKTARPPQAVGAAGKQGSEVAALTVAKATPGLRDYRRRLDRRDPKNPFRQHFTAPELKGAELSESGTSESSSSTSGGGSGEGRGEGGSATSGGATPPVPLPGNTDGKVRLFVATIKLQISRTEEDAEGNISMGAPAVREEVRPLTPLPGEKAPVVTYLGPNFETGRALLMVSKDVTATFGEAQCVSGTASCELLEVDLGIPEIFEYGANHVRYKINVLKFKLVPRGKT